MHLFTEETNPAGRYIRFGSVGSFRAQTGPYGIGELIQGSECHFLQSFTDRDSVPFEGFRAPDPEKLLTCQKILQGYVKKVQIRGT